MTNASSVLIPVGIDLGTLHTRVAIGDPIEGIVSSSSSSTTTPVLPMPNIIANAQGSRYTIALAVKEEKHEEERKGDNSPSSFVFGEAARRYLLRDKKVMEDYLVRHLCAISNTTAQNEENSTATADLEESSAFFSHMVELACQASTYNSVQPSQLRIVISMSPDVSKQTKTGLIQALENGVRQLVRRKEGKKAEKQLSDQIVAGVVSDASAACLAYGLLDNNTPDSKDSPSPVISSNLKSPEKKALTNILVIDWGASGLTLTHLQQILTNNYETMLKTKKTYKEPKCSGPLIVSALVSHCASLMERKHSSIISRGSLLKHTRAKSKLIAACEIAVKTLARTNVAQIAVDGVYEGLDLNCSLSKPRFDMLCGSLLRLAQKALTDFVDEIDAAEGTATGMDVVLMCGNVCQMPSAEALIKKMFDENVLLLKTKGGGGIKMDVDESVAIGCAKFAQQLLVGEQKTKQHQLENNKFGSPARIIATEEKKEMEAEVPISPIGIGITLLPSKNVISHTATLIDIGSPLPAHVSRVIKFDKRQEISTISVIQIAPNNPKSDGKIIAEIGGINAEETEDMEITLELSVEGKLTMAVNGGETVTL